MQIMRAGASNIPTPEPWYEKYTRDPTFYELSNQNSHRALQGQVMHSRAQRQDDSKLKPLTKQESVEVNIQCELLAGLQMYENTWGEENKNIYLPDGEVGAGKKGVFGRRRVFSLSNFRFEQCDHNVLPIP